MLTQQPLTVMLTVAQQLKRASMNTLSIPLTYKNQVITSHNHLFITIINESISG